MVDKKNRSRKKAGRKKPPPPPSSDESPVDSGAASREIGQDQTPQADHNVSDTAIVKLTAALVRWTRVMAVATIALGIVAYFQWRELHKTDETLQKTLVINQRPWVDIEASIDGPFSIGEKIAFLPLKVSMKNGGLSPAVNIRVRASMFNSMPRPMTFTELKNEWCYGEFAQKGVVLEDWYVILFPGQTQTIPLNAALSRDVDLKNTGDFDEETWMPSIIVCMDYRTTFSEFDLRTVKLYRVGESLTGGGFEPRMKIYQPSDLALFPYGNYAE